ncbi:hypothetical protein HPG69_013986 [Diceros bicornis minor]|uniref:Vomeronasal type-1 receptor n=1 Tax=Diceros bicornis minor TaxID=77932 RepID=A0A7J7EMP0_DICBM|nr:hypothetical protein HPG69_013986 [Diceros bicornis minor]
MYSRAAPRSWDWTLNVNKDKPRSRTYSKTVPLQMMLGFPPHMCSLTLTVSTDLICTQELHLGWKYYKGGKGPPFLASRGLEQQVLITENSTKRKWRALWQPSDALELRIMEKKVPLLFRSLKDVQKSMAQLFFCQLGKKFSKVFSAPKPVTANAAAGEMINCGSERSGCRTRSTDLIVKNLSLANLLVLFSSGIHYTSTSFGWYHVHNDFACRFVPYVQGVNKVMSIGTTCPLSVFQAITISPGNSRNSHRSLLKILEKRVGATKTSQTEKLVDTVLLFIMTKLKMRYMQHCYQSLMSSVSGSCSGPVAPWFSSCTGTSKGSNTFVGPVFPRSSPESRAMKTTLLLSSTTPQHHITKPLAFT